MLRDQTYQVCFRLMRLEIHISGRMVNKIKIKENPAKPRRQKQKIPEILLQHLWQSGELTGQIFQTMDGRKVDVIFQGWFNGSWGPDFKNAKVRVEEDLFFGDVELHVDEVSWYQHSHHIDEAYNRVILHVFIYSGQKRAVNKFGQLIPSIYLHSSSIKKFWDSVAYDQKYEQANLPGACGLLLNDRKEVVLRKVIQQAAETRLLIKASAFSLTKEIALGDKSEDFLYQSMFKSLGYGNDNDRFILLASRFPYSKIKVYFRSLARQNRLEVLSRWLGYLNYFEKVKTEQIHPELRREWLSFLQHWLSLEQDGIALSMKRRTPSRPLNSPIRRLFGFYYHLEHISFDGLAKSWLKFLKTCDQLMESENPKKKILNELDSMFPQPEWETLAYSISNREGSKKISKTRLVGRQRQLIILVNSVIPFFLCWARLNQDKEIERVLYALLLVLPAEGKNRKTTFMESRFQLDHNAASTGKNLAYHQGLIQLHDDYCTSFYEGCSQCTLLDLLDSA